MCVKAWRQNAMWGHDGEEKKWQIESDRLTNVSMKRDTRVEKKMGGRIKSLCGVLFAFHQNIYRVYSSVYVCKYIYI